MRILPVDSRGLRLIQKTGRETDVASNQGGGSGYDPESLVAHICGSFDQTRIIKLNLTQLLDKAGVKAFFNEYSQVY